MIDLKLGEYKFYLMIEADGGEIFWTDALYFVSKCGNQSAGIQEVPYNDYLSYQIDGYLPMFIIEPYYTLSTLCTI